jgi:hypothetical protein
VYWLGDWTVKRGLLVAAAVALVIVLAAGTGLVLSLRHGSNSVQLPAATAQVTVAVSPPLHDVQVLSRTYQLTPSGPLAHPQLVTLPLSRPAPAGWVVFAATAESGRGPWGYLPARLSRDRRSVTFATTHHSVFTVIGFDLAKLIRMFESGFLDGLDGNATTTVAQPSCPDQAEARTGYQIASSSGPAVYWCLGEDSSGQRILRVVNDRRYPMEVQHPGLTVAERPVIDYTQLSSLSHLLSGRDSILAPGGQIGYGVSLPAGYEAGVQTDVDGLGQGLYALQTGVNALLEILTRFGEGGASKSVTAISDALGDAACADALAAGNPGGILPSCFSPAELVDGFGPVGILLAPIVAAGSVVAFFESEWQGLHDILTRQDTYRIVVSRAALLPDHCGAVHQNGTSHSLNVTVTSGSVQCATALAIVNTYINNPPEQGQGSGDFVRIGPWLCDSTPGAVWQSTGHAGDCSSRQGHISIDAPYPGT